MMRAEEAGASTSKKKWQASGRYSEVFSRKDEDCPEFYSIAFNLIDPRLADVFAAVGRNKARIFMAYDTYDEEEEEDRVNFVLVQEYEEEGQEEQFFACTWSVGVDGDPLLCFAGIKGIIKIVNYRKERLECVLAGHGNAINDLKAHPVKHGLILSSSKDESLRIWNIQTRTVVMVLAGLEAHREEVFTADFHQSDGLRIVSGGSDHTAKIWDLEDHKELLDKSFQWDSDKSSSFPTMFIQTPSFTSDIHNHYLDCVQWYGDLLLSKSVHNSIILWSHEVGTNGGCDCAIPLKEFKLDTCEIFFMKFALSADHSLLSLGNTAGKVFVWDPERKGHLMKLCVGGRSRQCPVRQTSISYDNKYLVCCCENGTICCWKLSCKEVPSR